MNLALITIGNELLSGFTVDTNAAWIGKKLSKIGVQVSIHITIDDRVESIVSTLKSVSDKNAVIVTGGLGPTHDDVTSSSFFKYFDDTPQFSEEYWEVLTQRFLKITSTIPDLNRNQAMIPTKGTTIPNPVGSARGLQYEKDGCTYFSLPGVPNEMKAMMTESVLPFLEKKSHHNLIVRTIRTTGIPESALAEKVDIILREHPDVSMAFLPQLIGVDIRLTGKIESKISSCQHELESELGDLVFGYDNEGLENVVGTLLLKKGLTLSVAESCTGGLLAHRLTNIPGSSAYFKGGITSYSNEAKMKLLQVEEDTLERVGAVSSETAIEMAEGVRKLLTTDIGVGITGIAGPGGGTEIKPVGLVYIGFSMGEQSYAKKFIFSRDRKGNKYLTSQVALNMIRLTLKK